jgi:uncharacterized protein (DUF305 family)
MNNNKLSDIEYINHMIPHHQLAIDMSKEMILNTNSDIILALCVDIIRKQKYEIWEMSNMIKYSKKRDSINNMNNHIKKKTQITETKYLQHMIPHHQEAIDMSKKLLLYTTNSYLIELANKILIEQKAEIFKMKGLLNKTNISFESELLKNRINIIY